MGNFYDRYARHQKTVSTEAPKAKEVPKGYLPKFHGTIHTCPKNKRYIVLKGMGATVVDVTPGTGDPTFSLRIEDWNDYQCFRSAPEGYEDWDAFFLTYFRKLHDRNQVTWLRLLHNPNVAFICVGHHYSSNDGVLLTPRQITAKFLAKVFEEKGYSLQVKSDVKKL